MVHRTQMQRKRLLVNADDLGLTKAVTDGIIEAHQQGIVTSASIIAGAEAFDYAVKQALHNASLGVGVHLTLVEERPVANAQDIPTLVQSNGKLPGKYSQLLSGLVTGRIRSKHVEHELRAQIEKCIDAGLSPTHLDSHQHIHALPSLFRMVLRLAEEFQISGIRLPRDSPARNSVSWRGGFLQKTILCLLARWDGYRIRNTRVVSCERMVGLFESGVLHEDLLLQIVSSLPEGTTELVCHPGRTDAESLTKYSHWHYNWQAELNALTSKTVRDLLDSQRIELINYADLQRQNLPSPIHSAGPVR